MIIYLFLIKCSEYSWKPSEMGMRTPHPAEGWVIQSLQLTSPWGPTEVKMKNEGRDQRTDPSDKQELGSAEARGTNQEIGKWHTKTKHLNPKEKVLLTHSWKQRTIIGIITNISWWYWPSARHAPDATWGRWHVVRLLQPPWRCYQCDQCCLQGRLKFIGLEPLGQYQTSMAELGLTLNSKFLTKTNK